MKLYTPPTKRALNQSAFTLIEMIGVLAVIAILAALLIPKVFNAIADAKINNVVVSAETIKTAIADHYGKYGKFDTLQGTTALTATAGTPYTGYDTNVLMPEGLLDKPFQTKVGTGWTIQFRPCDTALGTTVDGTGPDYALDGNNTVATGTNTVVGQYVVEAVISGVSEPDAQAISDRLDGPKMSTTSIGTSDFSGRVKYAAPTSGGNTTVYIYLTHR